MQNNLENIKLHCINDNIPIIRDNTAIFIDNIINENKIKNILEVGTAYGYSAYYFSCNKNIETILTIEKNNNNYKIAKKYFKNNKKVKIINEDCFLFTTKTKYDLIFLDGPKAHQIELIEKYFNYLNNNGIMVVDNIYLKDVLPTNKNKIKLLEKVKKTEEYLRNTTKFNVEIVDLDDGIALIRNNKR